MNIDKAIKILSRYMQGKDDAHPLDFDDAVLLGIEALKRVKWHKEQHQPGYYELLPGETDK